LTGIVVDASVAFVNRQRYVSNVLPLAREYDLSAYDAAYLDVAVRQGAPLATLDRILETAGRSAGIKIFKA
jgi:predicted nucleic acid-binding protein